MSSQRKKQSGKSSSSRKTKESVEIQWPATFVKGTPLYPQVETVLSSQVYTISNFFSKRQCSDLLNEFRKLELQTTPLTKSKEYAARVNDRMSIQDPIAANILWLQLQAILQPKEPDYELSEEEESIRSELLSEFETAVGLNPQLRIYRYKPGQFFDKHYDESVTCDYYDGTIDGELKLSRGTTRWTLLIYLTDTSDGLQGGETTFYLPKSKDSKKVSPEKGMALLHKHGDDCLLHEGEKVNKGEKWILRSDVVYR